MEKFAYKVSEKRASLDGRLVSHRSAGLCRQLSGILSFRQEMPLSWRAR